MADFEYLGNIAMSQYLPLDSFVHRRDPRAKLAGFALIIISLTMVSRLFGALIGLLLVVFLLLASRVPMAYALRGLIKPLPFIFLLAVLQIFIFPKTADAMPLFKIFGYPVVAEGIYNAALLILRFCGLILVLTVSSAAVSTLEMIHALDLLLKPFKKLGLRLDNIAITIQITLRFIPFLAMNAEKIAKSQASRGAEWGRQKPNLMTRMRQTIPLLIPLFNGSLHQAETLADAMIARGYVSGKARTGLAEYQFGWKDFLFLLGCLLISVLILLPVYPV